MRVRIPPGEGAILGVSIHGHTHGRYIQQDDVAFYQIAFDLLLYDIV